MSRMLYLKDASYSLKAQIHELQPKPRQSKHQHHVRKGKTEPAGKVDHIMIFWKNPVKKVQMCVHFIIWLQY